MTAVKLDDILAAREKLNREQQQDQIEVEQKVKTKQQAQRDLNTVTIKIVRTIKTKDNVSTKYEIENTFGSTDIIGMRRHLADMGFHSGESISSKILRWLRGGN
jgi:hypothetical protein